LLKSRCLKSRCSLTAFSILCLSAAGLLAQDKKLNEDPNTRSVQGIVSSAASKSVTGSVVQLKDTKTLQIRSYVTHDDGAYHFAGLSTNVDYELKAETPAGQSSGTKRLSNFDGRKAATVNLPVK
jgi:hypothetical protein